MSTILDNLVESLSIDVLEEEINVSFPEIDEIEENTKELFNLNDSEDLSVDKILEDIDFDDKDEVEVIEDEETKVEEGSLDDTIKELEEMFTLEEEEKVEITESTLEEELKLIEESLDAELLLLEGD